MKAVWNNTVIAESDDTVIVEGNHYFPADSLQREFFTRARTDYLPVEGRGLVLSRPGRWQGEPRRRLVLPVTKGGRSRDCRTRRLLARRRSSSIVGGKRRISMAASPAHSFATYPSLRDASVIVTGGASGIGMEIVRAFAGQGSRVAFLDFDVDGGRLLAAELQAGGGHVRFEPCDLRDIDALRRAVTALADGSRSGTRAGQQCRA